MTESNSNSDTRRFDLNNYNYKQLKDLCTRKDRNEKGLFHKANKKLFEWILDNHKKIINENKIDLGEIVPKEEHEWLIGTFMESNKGVFVSEGEVGVIGRLKPEIEQTLIHTIKAMVETQNEMDSSNVIDDTRSKLKNVEDNYRSNRFYAKKKFNFTDFMLNAMLDNDIRYSFNSNIPEANEDRITDQVCTIGVNISSYVGVRELVTKKQVSCTTKSKKGVECGNVVYFNDIHETSSIKCTDSLPLSKYYEGMASHSIKNVSSKALIKEKLRLYMYQGKTEKEELDILIFSLDKIDSKFVKANMVSSGVVSGFGSGQTMNICIAIDDKNLGNKNMLPEGKKIFPRDSSIRNDWVEDAYYGMVNYLEKYQGIKVKNRGKINGIILIKQILFNEYLDLSTKSIIIGTSGIGKSFYNKIFSPLLTSSYTTVYGDEVTRNRLMGGQPPKEDIKLMGSYVPGLVSTHNFICFEESTKALDEMFRNENNYTEVHSKNIFNMMKGCDNKYDTFTIAIQGGKKAVFISSTMAVGNSENMVMINKELHRQLRKAYGQATKPPYKESWPLTKPISYYRDVMKNEKLAKAHQKVRTDLYPRFYMTFLYEAEQGRFEYSIYLESAKDDFPKEILQRISQKDTENMHRAQSISELKEIYGDEKLPQKVWLNSPLAKSVEKLLLKHIRGPNNFVYKKSSANRQLLANIARESTADIITNRVWFNKGLKVKDACKDELTEQEKMLLVDNRWRYNYNSLTPQEAAMIKKPDYQIFPYDPDDLSNEIYKEETENKNLNEGINVEIEEDAFKEFEDL